MYATVFNQAAVSESEWMMQNLEEGYRKLWAQGFGA
jgi:hypothetical protein